MNLDLLDVSEIINRACESARVFGIDFYSVLTRGSQFKVESMMLRIAKPENFVLISPSRAQVMYIMNYINVEDKLSIIIVLQHIYIHGMRVGRSSKSCRMFTVSDGA